MPSLLLIQWGVVAFFVFIYFLLGFMRGGSKSTYFTIVAFITTFLSLFLISFISLNLFLSDSFTLVNLLEMANGYAGGVIPQEVMTFAADPLLAAVAIAIVDLVLRIVGFIVLYPIIKGLISLIVFRPIWSFGIKKALLKRQNERMAEMPVKEGQKPFKPSKKLKKTLGGRFVGAGFGAIQGLLVSFIFLLPLIVISGFLTVVRPDNTTTVSVSEQSPSEMFLPGLDLGGLATTVDDYLTQIDEMNTSGFSAMIKQITISGQPLDRYVFDRIFTTQVKQDEDVTDINWIKELEGLVKIVRVVYDGGYLEGDFGLADIDEDVVDDVGIVFDYFENSDLFGFMIPTAVEIGLENFRDQLPADISDELADNTIDRMRAIDWNQEFGNIEGIVRALLTFGSVEELMTYSEDPNLMLQLTPEEAEKLGDIVRAIGDMQVLSLISVAAEYATTMQEVQDQIAWLAEDEREAYLQERLSFLIDDYAFFSGQDGEFARLAELVEAIYTDEFGDVDLVQLISTSDAEAFLEAQNEEWIDNLLEKFVELQLIIEVIPVGVDYAFYTQVGDMVDEDMASDLEAALAEIDWQAEILNVGDIYKEAVKIGAAQLLGDNPDMLAFVDDVAANNMDGVRTIVSKIFEESALVGAALEIASPVLVERFVEDQDLAGILQEVLISDPVSGEVDFNVGQEINTILDIVEKIYLFTTASEITNLSGMTTDAQIELLAGFGSITETEFEELKTSFEELQLFERAGESGLNYIKNTSAIEQLYVPDGVSLGTEIGSILGLTYYAAKYTYENKDLYATFEEIDFAPLFADETFRSYLLPTDLNNHSNFLLSNIAFNAKYYANDESMSQYLSVPTSLRDASPESEAWMDELNALLGAIFDIAASFEDSEVLTLSARDVILFTEDPTAASIELITQFADPLKADETFGSLDSSVVLRSSLKNVIDSLGDGMADSLGGHIIRTPENAIENNMLKEGVFVELINGLAIMIEDLNQTWQFTTLSQVTESLNADVIIPAYNNLQDSSLISFGNITLIQGILSELLLSSNFQTFAVNTINEGQDIFQAPLDLLELDPLLLEDGDVKGDEIGNLLIAIKSLQLPGGEVMETLGPDLLNDMLGRNDVAGVDDFDRLLNSGILYTFLDKIIQLNIFESFANDALSGAFGDTPITLDLSPHPASLGNEIDHEPIEVGRIPKEEFRDIIISLGLLGDVNAVGIETFPNMVNPYASSDDFSTFLNSDYIYVIVGRLFENQGFGDYVGDTVSDAFGGGIDLDMAAPEDAKGTTGVEEGIMTKAELRRIMISFKLLGLDEGTDIDIAGIFSLPGKNLIGGQDDFDRFIGSKYIADKLSIALMSDAIIDTIGADRFEPIDFVLPPSSYTVIGGRERLTDTEFRNIFVGLETLGVSDFQSSGFTPDQVTGLTQQQLTDVLASNYVYTIIDLMLKSETSFTVPPTALETAGEYTGMVKKSEILDIFKAIEIFNISGGTAPDPATINVGQIQDLLDQTDSAIVQSLLSDAIIQALGAENIPAEAYEDGTLLTQTEIEAIVDALAVISGDPDAPITDIDVNNVTVGQINDLDLTDTGSYTIKQIISDAILDTINPSNIPEEAYSDFGLSQPSGIVLLSTTLDAPALRRLSDDELQEIIGALNILADNDPNVLITAISTDVKVGQAVQLKTNSSLIIKQLVSDNVESVLVGVVVIPDASYIDPEKTRLSNDEINNMIDAMVVLANNDLELPVSMLSTDVTVGQTVGLKTNESLIIRQLITDNVDDVLASSAVVIHLDAYDSEHPTMLSMTEVGQMIDALVVLANDDLNMPVASISTDVTVGQTQDLKTNESLIIRQLITDNIDDVLAGTVVFPGDAYDTNYPTMLTTDEISQMIDALVVLADNDLNLPVTSISTNVTVGQTQGLKDNESLIINQLVSDKIVETLSLTSTIPDSAYVDPITKTILKDREIDDMIDALYILADGDDAMLVANVPTDVTIGQLKGLSVSTSIIIQRLITDSITDSVPLTYFPDDAYLGGTPGDQLEPTEIANMILALEVLANSEVPGDRDDVLVSGISTDVTVGQTQSLKTNNSLIINQLISESIVDTLSLTATIPDEAYIDPVGKETLKDTEIDDMIDALYILANEDDNVLVSAISTDVTIGQLKGLANSPSSIMRRLITDSIVDTIDPLDEGKIPLASYEGGVDTNYLTYDEVNDMIGALEILAGSEVPGDRDTVVVGTISTDITLGQLDDLTDSESLIMQQLISDSIIDAVGEAKVPDDAYISDTPGNNLKSTEIDDMVDALYILAYDPLNPAQDLDDVLVANVNFNVTVGQTQDLKTNGSVIIKQVISDSIVDMLTLPKIRETAFNDPVEKDRLTNDEIGYMIDSLLILAGGDDTVLVTAITVNESSLSIATLKQFDENSIVLNRLISNAIIDGLGEADMPDESFEDDVARTDLIRPEIDALLDALEILGIGTSGAGTIATNQLTFTKLDQVIAIGTTDPVNYPLGFSPIVVHVLSEPMIAAVSDIRSGHEYGVPTTAYRANGIDLLHPEIEGLVDAIKLIGNVQPENEDTTTIADITINANNFNGTLISNLVALDKLIVYRLISKGINDSGIDTDPSHVLSGPDVNYDPGLPVTPLVYDIKIAEMNHIATSMNILGISSIANVASEITVPALKALSSGDIETLVEAISDGPNTIIYHLISSTVDSTNTLFDGLSLLDPITYPDPDVYYVYDGPTRVRLKRTSIATALSEL